jgi:hypothetical protein
MAAYTQQQIAAAMRKAGFPKSAIPIGTAVVMAESGGQSIKSSVDPNSWGPWQINLDAHNISREQANNLQSATNYAYQLYQQQGWQPWSAYTSGAYQKFLGGGAPMPNPEEGPDTSYEAFKKSRGGGTTTTGDSPIEATQKQLNLRQDYAKYISDIYGVDPAVAETFLRNNPELLAGLITNFDLSDQQAQSRFVKLLLEMEQKGELGSNLGAKAGSLTTSISSGSSSRTTSSTSSRRDVTPSEAESIFKLELEWQKQQKQAPLEAGKFIQSMGPGAYVPPEMAGKMMPGMEPGGPYSSALPGMDTEMFRYKGTPGVEALTSMFQMDETGMMGLARQIMQNAMLNGVMSGSTTNSNTIGSGSTNQSMTQPMGGGPPPLSPLQQAAAAQSIMGGNPSLSGPMPNQQGGFGSGSYGPAAPPSMPGLPGAASPAPAKPGWLQQAWNSIFR